MKHILSTAMIVAFLTNINLSAHDIRLNVTTDNEIFNTYPPSGIEFIYSLNYASLEYGPKLTDIFFGGLNTQIPSVQFSLQANSLQYGRFSFFINSSAGISWLLKDEFKYEDTFHQEPNKNLTGNY